MSRTLTRPMFRKGGEVKRSNYMGGGIKAVRPRYMGGGMTGIMSGITPDAGLTPRTGFQEGTTMFNRFLTETPFGRELQKIATATNRNIADVVTAVYDMGGVPANKITEFFTGANPGFSGTRFTQQIPIIGDSISERDPDKAYFFGATTDAAPKAGIFGEEKKQEIVKDDKPSIENIPAPDKKEDPEKSLMDVYGENKGIIDQVLGNSDDSTKREIYLQLARFGAGLAAQPGGDLVGAIGKAAEKPLEGVGEILAKKDKSERDTKLLALQKTFDDMKEPEQVKLVKAIQKEYGFDTFAEAYDFISKPKKSSAEINQENKFYRETAAEMGVSTEGFRREMEKLDEKGFGKYIGNFTRPDALLPDDAEDRVNGEYYITPKGVAVRVVGDALYTMDDPEFVKKIETKKA